MIGEECCSFGIAQFDQTRIHEFRILSIAYLGFELQAYAFEIPDVHGTPNTYGHDIDISHDFQSTIVASLSRLGASKTIGDRLFRKTDIHAV